MIKRELRLLGNALDALDRLYDGASTVTDLQALLYATGEALRGTDHAPHFERQADALLPVARSGDTAESKRNLALGITDELRHYLADLLPWP